MHKAFLLALVCIALAACTQGSKKVSPLEGIMGSSPALRHVGDLFPPSRSGDNINIRKNTNIRGESITTDAGHQNPNRNIESNAEYFSRPSMSSELNVNQ